MIPLGISLHRQRLRDASELPTIYPEVDFKVPMVRSSLMFIGLATLLNVLIVQ